MRSYRLTDGDVTRRARAAPRITLIAVFGLYVFCWPLAVVGISRDMRLPIDERWAASAILFLDGLIAFLSVAVSYAWRRALTFALVVLPIAFSIEFIGATTGLPFGRYHYTGALVPSVLGRVPAPITCAWLMIILGSLAAARTFARRGGRTFTVVIAAVLATGLDACLEPTAFHVKAYWLWDQHGRYYGVPALNFAGWFAATLLVTASAAMVLYRGAEADTAPRLYIPTALFWSTVALFAIVDFFRGYPLGAAIGATLGITAVAAAGRAACHARTDATKGDMTFPSTPRNRAIASGSSSQE